jgi:hypothetical protein
MPQHSGLRSHQQPSLALVQMREQHRELHSELATSLIRDAHTTATSFETGSNTLIPCKPLEGFRFPNVSVRFEAGGHELGS